MLHAAYVVAEAGVLLQMTRYTVFAFREGEEAAGLFTHVGREPNRFDLRVRQLPVQTEAGRVGRDSLANLGCAIGCIIQGLDRISGNTRRIAGANDDLNTRAARQAGDLLQTDEAVTSIASGADTNALSATSASDHVNRIIDSMNEGDALMSQLVSQMQEVSHFSDQINAFVGVIDGIAFQTNILALNAAVEAARAGEQGRGFAVVAAEVRSLAQRAAGAAREVHQLIGRSGQAIANSATLAEQSGRNVKDLVQATSALQTLIDAIQSASAEQSSAVLQIQQTVSELNRLTQDNASLANDNALITRELHDDVEQVYDVLKAFDTDKA
ncbi:MAG: methyl-accepting chemotaxis protein [Burkholderiaceae bacterium]